MVESSFGKIIRDQVQNHRARRGRQHGNQNPEPCNFVTQQGFRYEPDLRHVVVVSEIGLESAKSVSTSWTDACESSSPLDAEHVKKDQSISARVHFPAQGRMDLRCAAKECGER